MTTEVKSQELTWHSSDLDEVVKRFNRAEYVSKQMKQHPEVHNWVYSCLSCFAYLKVFTATIPAPDQIRTLTGLKEITFFRFGNEIDLMI